MTCAHKELAAGRRFTLSFMEQMANTGGEVERTMLWRQKNRDYSAKALERALELLDLTIADPRNCKRLRELCRVRELVVDYSFGDNQYGSSDRLWRGCFLPFAYAARRDR